MIRNCKMFIYFIAALLMFQLGFGGLVTMPQKAVAASSGPVKQSVSPSSGASNVPLNAKLILTFDENVKKGTGNAMIYIRNLDSGTLFDSFAVTDNRVTIGPGSSKNVVTINPGASKPFALNTSYYVYIDPGAFLNESNSAAYDGLTSTMEWNFRTVSDVDNKSPELVLNSPLSPANGETNVAIGSVLRLTFDEPVYAVNNNIVIRNTATGQSSDTQYIPVVSASVTGSGTNTVTISPLYPLRGDSPYEVTIPSGAFQDASGNSFTGVNAGNWSWRTALPPLGVPSLSPLNNSYGFEVDRDLVLTFPGNVTAETGLTKWISINQVSNNELFYQVAPSAVRIEGGNKVIINPPSNLKPNTGYYVLIDPGAFKDTATGTNLYEGITDARKWTFSTNSGFDIQAPRLLTERKPAAGGTQPTTSFDLEMNFDEPVYPGTGNVVIKSYPSGAAVATIPITSNKVTGGGTSKITVKPGIVFTNNTSYYVQIGSQALVDASGNNYPGISDTTSWSFRVTQDNVKPTLATITPVNNAVDVGLTGIILTATFSEQVQPGSGTIRVKRISGSSGNAEYTTSVTIDPSNNRKLNLAVNGTLAANTKYYVEIPAAAVIDMAGNAYDGILNQYQWTFNTTSATGAPAILKSEMSGTTRIVLTYNKALDPAVAVAPLPASFYVTVNNSGRTVTKVEVTGQTVILTLSSGIVYGQVIKLSYTPGTTYAIQDLTGLKAVGFSNRDVTNSPDTTLPKPLNGSVTGNSITLTFNEELAAVSSYGYSQFSVNVAGSYRSVTNITGVGSLLFLTFNGSAVTNGQNVTLSYTASSYPLRDLAGNGVSSFSGFFIQNGQDTRTPVLQTVTAVSSTVTLTYDEPLNPNVVPSTSAFAVTVNGSARSVTQVKVSGSQVILTLSSGITSGQTVLVSYLGGYPGIADFGGNSVPAFSGMTANAGSNVHSLYGAVVKGALLTMSFSSTMNSSYKPSTSQFTVKVNDAFRNVSSVSIVDSNVLLTLSTPVAIGDRVSVSYLTSGTALQTTNGTLIPAFGDVGVANQTTWADNPNGDYETAADGGIGIKLSAATTQSDTSPANRNAKRYVLSADKVAGAYNTVNSVGGMEPRVVFTVPESELAAIVAVPLSALNDAKKNAANATFVVAYRDVTYEIPLSALDALQSSAGSGAQLLIQIDTNAGSVTPQLVTALSGARAQQLISPINFEASVVNNGPTKVIENFSSYVKRTVSTAVAIDPRSTAVVWFDPQTGKLSYVPTRVESKNSKSIISFERKGNSTYAFIKGSVTYTDLGKHWARNDILLMANKYIVEGRTLTAFEPAKPITRGEFAMFIAKGLGLSGDKQAAGKFKDVNTSTVLAAYIGAASKAGIVQGMTDGSFKPNSPITREEIATMMVRAARAAGVQIDLSQDVTALLKRFTDRAKIGTWAKNDVAKAVQSGIINGMSNGAYGAKSNASRAEAAVMIKRLLEYVEFIDS
ncbi:Ig-like domain-containing protein [Paenibacillus mendelii]|uniref:Ig-like domain-containing protein n=1 Tax=Paenibacillus mendelii TaxID=206163 RepID=A0ABV6J3I3_9BACL|nr:Ig-like domain-containing protein [Paenibacillus mendelii]MCQ6561885.1 Ig-like domain-containing protein [Paenibacillus mendelii]